VVAQPDERHANRTASVLEWYDRLRAYTNLVQTKKKKDGNVEVLGTGVDDTKFEIKVSDAHFFLFSHKFSSVKICFFQEFWNTWKKLL